MSEVVAPIVTQTLQSLNEEIHRLEARRISLIAEIRPLSQEVTKTENRLRELSQKIKEMSKEPRVSDHAVIRFLERKYGISFEDIRSEILTENIKQAIRLGATSVKIDGMQFVVKDRCIVTAV